MEQGKEVNHNNGQNEKRKQQQSTTSIVRRTKKQLGEIKVDRVLSKMDDTGCSFGSRQEPIPSVDYANNNCQIGNNTKGQQGPTTLPNDLDQETLRLVKGYLLEEYCNIGLPQGNQDCTIADNSWSCHTNSEHCDEDGMVAFMTDVNRQAMLQAEIVVQANFLLHNDARSCHHHHPTMKLQQHRSNRSNNNTNGSGFDPEDGSSISISSTDRMLEDFVKVQEEQALARDLFSRMIHQIEKKAQRSTVAKVSKEQHHNNCSSSNVNHEDKNTAKNTTNNNSAVLDQRTLAWLRASSGCFNSVATGGSAGCGGGGGGDVSSAKDNHQVIQSILQSGGRLTRGMISRHHQVQQQQSNHHKTRQQQDHQQQRKNKKQQQRGFDGEGMMTEGLAALVLAIDDLEKDSHTACDDAAESDGRSKKRKAPTPTKVLRKRRTKVATRSQGRLLLLPSSSHQANTNVAVDPSKASQAAKSTGTPPKSQTRGRIGAAECSNTRLLGDCEASSLSSLERTATSSSSTSTTNSRQSQYNGLNRSTGPTMFTRTTQTRLSRAPSALEATATKALSKGGRKKAVARKQSLAVTPSTTTVTTRRGLRRSYARALTTSECSS